MPCGNTCGEITNISAAEERLPQYPVLPLEGTYLVWIDCRALGIGSDATTLHLQEQQKLMVNSGTMYGPGGEGFIRLNIACPRTLLADGLERIPCIGMLLKD